MVEFVEWQSGHCQDLYWELTVTNGERYDLHVTHLGMELLRQSISGIFKLGGSGRKIRKGEIIFENSVVVGFGIDCEILRTNS